MRTTFLAALVAAAMLLPTQLSAHEFDPNILKEPVRVTGIVLNPDGSRVLGAAIKLLESGQTTVSNSEGVFVFERVFYPEITLQASSSDYETVEVGPLDSVKTSGESVTITFDKIKSFESTIVITATREERLLKDVPVRTEVITSEQIEKRAAVTLADVLDATSGLRVENNCQNCGFNQLRINGLEGGYTHVLVDNLNAFSSLAGVYGLEHIPAVIIDRVEVVKGGASSLYGAGAVGGVVNVITRQPTKTAFSFETNYEDLDGEPGGNVRGWGSWVGRKGHTAIFAYGNYATSDAYDRNGDGYTDLGYKHLHNGGARLYQRALDDHAQLEVGFEAGHEDRRGGSSVNLEPHESDLTEWAETYRYAYTLNWDHSINGETYYRVQFAQVQTDRDSYYGSGMDPYAYGETSNPHTNLAFSFGHTISTHSLLAGLQYERDEITDAHPGYNYTLDQVYDNYGFFLQDDFKLHENVSLIAGARIDNHSALDDPVFSPRLSLLLTATEEFRIRTNVSFGFKAPVAFDEDLHILVSGGEPQFITNDPNLKEERARSLSLSGEYTPTLGDIASRFEVNGFYTKLDDTFVLDEVTQEGDEANLFTRINGGSSKVFGVELNADLDVPGGFDIESGFTFQRAKLDEPEPDFGATRFFRTPDSYGYVFVGYEHPRFSLSGRLEYTGSMLAPHFAGWIEEDTLEETDPFTIFNVRLSIPLTLEPYAVSVVVNGYNLTDEFQEDLDQGMDRDAGYVYGPRRPRTLGIGLKVDF